MSTRTSKLPVSVPNAILIASTLAGAIVTGVLGNIPATGILLILAVGGVISALLARRPGASDWLRINAVEYRDERDKRLALDAFAVVGIVALIAALACVVAAALYAGFVGHTTVSIVLLIASTLQLLVLSIAWGWANTVVVRRG
jgi:hypothetical protein